MTPDVHLEEFAKTPNWIAFGKALSAALDDPVRYGFADPSQLLAQVAQLRGVDPSSLRNPLAAVNWMKRNAPKALEEENPKLPMTGVLTLSQISILSSGLAESLAPRFFSGEMSRRELQTALRGAETEKGGRGVTAHERMRRSVEFEEDVFQHLELHPEDLGLGGQIHVVRAERDRLLPSDFTVLENGQPIAAIECKSHRSKLHRRHLIEVLAMAELMTREYQQAILIVPNTWGSSVRELSRLSRDLRLMHVRIAEFSAGPDLSSRLSFIKP
ncbi:MAG: hypothetical protein Q4P24_12755 [Rhodobacterales bacterium]|nr:hypothetical protein [Rhodobacterales bacterium]